MIKVKDNITIEELAKLGFTKQANGYLFYEEEKSHYEQFYHSQQECFKYNYAIRLETRDFYLYISNYDICCLLEEYRFEDEDGYSSNYNSAEEVNETLQIDTMFGDLDFVLELFEKGILERRK